MTSLALVGAGAAGFRTIAGRLLVGFRFSWFVRRGSFLIRVAAIIGLVEARSLEDDRAAGAKQSAQLKFLALGTLS